VWPLYKDYGPWQLYAGLQFLRGYFLYMVDCTYVTKGLRRAYFHNFFDKFNKLLYIGVSAAWGSLVSSELDEMVPEIGEVV